MRVYINRREWIGRRAKEPPSEPGSAWDPAPVVVAAAEKLVESEGVANAVPPAGSTRVDAARLGACATMRTHPRSFTGYYIRLGKNGARPILVIAIVFVLATLVVLVFAAELHPDDIPALYRR
jgi:hypothetical protein